MNVPACSAERCAVHRPLFTSFSLRLAHGVWARIAFGMLPTSASALPAFELWEEEGVLRLVLGNSAPIDAVLMKDILRSLHRLDPVGGEPLMVEQEELVRMTADAKAFLVRACRSNDRPVAFMAFDLPDRIQGEFFARFHKPGFPFRVFAAREHALDWFGRYATGLRVVR